MENDITFESGTRIKLRGDPNRTGTFVRYSKTGKSFTTKWIEVQYGIILWDAMYKNGNRMGQHVPIDQLVKIEEK